MTYQTAGLVIAACSGPKASSASGFTDVVVNRSAVPPDAYDQNAPSNAQISIRPSAASLNPRLEGAVREAARRSGVVI